MRQKALDEGSSEQLWAIFQGHRTRCQTSSRGTREQVVGNEEIFGPSQCVFGDIVESTFSVIYTLKRSSIIAKITVAMILAVFMSTEMPCTKTVTTVKSVRDDVVYWYLIQ
jgi:hypothetical protein